MVNRDLNRRSGSQRRGASADVIGLFVDGGRRPSDGRTRRCSRDGLAIGRVGASRCVLMNDAPGDGACLSIARLKPSRSFTINMRTFYERPWEMVASDGGGGDFT